MTWCPWQKTLSVFFVSMDSRFRCFVIVPIFLFKKIVICSYIRVCSMYHMSQINFNSDYASFLDSNRWHYSTWLLIDGCMKDGFSRKDIERHLLSQSWQTIPEFQGILNPNSSTGSFDATLDGNSLCHISYHPSKTFPAIENEVTVTWYPGTSNNRVEKWSLVFLRNQNNLTLIRNQMKCVSSFNFERETTIEMNDINQNVHPYIPTMSSMKTLHSMWNLLKL
jgi:hypothetical protein